MLLAIALCGSTPLILLIYTHGAYSAKVCKMLSTQRAVLCNLGHRDHKLVKSGFTIHDCYRDRALPSPDSIRILNPTEKDTQAETSQTR